MTLTDYLPAGMDLDDAIVALAAVAAFLTVIVIWYGLLVRDPLGARLRGLAQRREALMAGIAAPRRHSTRMRSLGLMHRVVDHLKLLRSAKTRDIADKLARAGWRSKDALVAYVFFKAVMPMAAGLATALPFYAMNATELAPLPRLLVVLAFVFAGFYAPDILVKNAADKRRHKLRLSVPDALDLMVICAESGLSLDATLKRVSREMARPLPEIADEFGLTAVELGFLPERSMALKNLSKRTDLSSIRGVVNTLNQTERYGTPLAQSLRVLAAEFRNERLMKAEEKAARLPAIMTVPMILFILPPLFIVLLGPGILRFIDTLSAAGIY